MAYPNEVYTTFSFLGLLMCLIPLPCHLKAYNVGTCLYIFWAGTGCLVNFINSIVWNGNVVNRAPIWCEICTRFVVASSFGIPAASLCISRRLYLVQLGASRNQVRFNKKNSIVIDLITGLCLPLLSIPIFYISQGHKFDLLEDIGCSPAIYNTWVAVLSIYLPPLLIALVSAFYAIRTFYAINKMRAQFKQLLTRDSDMTYSLYFRLMALAGTEILFTISITTAYIALNSMSLDPWISWDDTHYHFDRVDQYPGFMWRQEIRVAQQLELTRWLYIVCAILFFSFFGVAEEVRKLYGPPFQYVSKRLGICRRRSDGITFQRATFSNSDASTRNEKWSSYRSDITLRDIHTIDHSDSIHLSPCPSLHSSTSPCPVPECDV